MKFTESALPGAFIIDIEPVEDERGFFARTFCRQEFEAHGLNPGLAQCSVSFNPRKGTLRGMHFQAPPLAEAKLVRCTLGAAYDVVVDLRPTSPTFRQWTGVELTAANRKMIYVAEGLAHGFITLGDDTEMLYQMSEFFDPACARGVRWNDPAFGIRWPQTPRAISERDQGYPDFSI